MEGYLNYSQDPHHAKNPRLRSRKVRAALRYRCLLNAHNPYLVCAIHPFGPDDNSCLDFRPATSAELEELWEPEGASYYSSELILQPRQRWTKEEQLELLDTHPMFTGRCPHCEHPFPRYERLPVHWDCVACGWMDDTV